MLSIGICLKLSILLMTTEIPSPTQIPEPDGIHLPPWRYTCMFFQDQFFSNEAQLIRETKGDEEEQITKLKHKACGDHFGFSNFF